MGRIPKGALVGCLEARLLEAAKGGASLAAVVEPFRHRLMAVLAP